MAGANRQEMIGADPGNEKTKKVWQALSTVIDPEVGLDIVTMGLIYKLDTAKDNVAIVEMTLTTKGCPMSGYLKDAAEKAVQQAYPDDDVIVVIVWDPPWSPAMISKEGLERVQR